MFCRVLLLFISISLTCAQAATQTRDTITKMEIRTSPPPVTDRKLRDLIWKMFKSQDYRTKRRPENSLSNLSLRTQSQSTEVPGLCRYDIAWVEFEPVSTVDEGANTPTKPTGITADSYFRFFAPPAAVYDQITGRLGRQHRQNTACGEQSNEEGYFEAEDEQTATNGYLAWVNLQDALRNKRKIPLTCELFNNDMKTCEEIILELRFPDQIETCETPARDYTQWCYRAQFNDRLITMIVTGQVSPGPPAGQIVSAKLDGLILLAHPIID